MKGKKVKVVTNLEVGWLRLGGLASKGSHLKDQVWRSLVML